MNDERGAPAAMAARATVELRAPDRRIPLMPVTVPALADWSERVGRWAKS
ncbi:hypothetical protein BH10PSE14_BH10PSE14_06410 [soil metagenome]